MKLLISLFLFIFLLGCNTNNQVYWCGDHACINKKEKEEFFRNTMTVEVKDLNNNKKKKLSEFETIKEQAGVQKNTILTPEELIDNVYINKKEEKKLKKRILAEQKIKLKEEKKRIKEAKIQAKKNKKKIKNMKKASKLKKKKLAKEKKLDEKKVIKTKKIDNDIKITTSLDTDNVIASLNSGSNKFSELVKNIYKKNMLKSYPNINDIP